jgi:hypothetical protein
LIYRYAERQYYELKYSGIAADVFTRVRERADKLIGSIVPDSVKRLSAIYDNLQSESAEDWSNAVHGCRRVLQDLANQIFPAQVEPRRRVSGAKTITIDLGPENYVNRIVAFVEDSAESKRFQEIVGSHLSFLGNRLDSVVKAANKGTHATVSKEEADRCVIYTYLLVGDILTLASGRSHVDSSNSDFSFFS